MNGFVASSIERLITMDTHRDSRVAPLNAADARELIEVRLSLAPSGNELAATRQADSEIAVMRTVADKLLPMAEV